MQRSMQTHFNGNQLGMDLCNQLILNGVHHFRLSGTNLDNSNTMLAEADMCGANHLLIIPQDLELLKKIQGRNVEWGNEPDGDIRPSKYYDSFMAAYEICQTNNNLLHGPAFSNLDLDSLGWFSTFMSMGVPKDFIVTYHHYTPDVFFWQSHRGFKSRTEEIEALKRIAKGREIACSESGYNDSDEERQAENVVRELEFAEVHRLKFWTYYQINDDPINNEHFGARRTDFTWKPVIESFAL